jgi:dGTP triphosphohydrolase
MKDIETLDLVMPKIPTKSLYKLQVSVAQEIQSRERYDMMNLQIAQEENMVQKEAIIQEGKKKEIAQQKVDQMETQIDGVFQDISYDTVSEEASMKENITKIVKNIQHYKEHIKEQEERALPMTLPVV